MFRKNQNENTQVKKNLYLIERIQPAGGISFSDEKYVSTGEERKLQADVVLELDMKLAYTYLVTKKRFLITGLRV